MIAANEYNNQTNKQTHTHTQKQKQQKKQKKTKTKKKQKNKNPKEPGGTRWNQVEPGGSISWCVHLGMIFINIS